MKWFILDLMLVVIGFALTFAVLTLRDWIIHELNKLTKAIDTMAATAQELIDAATTLSTAADALSVKTDTLVDRADKLITALQGVSLPPEADAALAGLKAATLHAAAAGAKVDAEVAKADQVLPAHAPAAPTEPVAVPTPAPGIG